MTAMLRLLATVGLLTVVLMNVGETHRYKSPEYRQKFSVKEVEGDFTREQADGYEECEEFLNEPANARVTEENSLNEVAANGMHHFLKRHTPKPFDQICRKYECPTVQKLEQSGCGFQTRIVPRANWTVTEVDLSAEEGLREAYIRLHRYRSGVNNERGLKMGFVVPVIKRWWLDENSKVVRATMSFYIPAEYQSNPPKSTDKEVRVEEWGDARVYSRAYGGYREDPKFLEQFDLLKTALEKEGITPYPHMRITAGYSHHGFGRQRLEVVLLDNDS